MFTVALLAQKGGVGKTTLTLSLAVQAQLSGARSGVVDADPQATASSWFINRRKHEKDTPIVAAASDPASIRQAIDDARDDDFDWLFIDTPAGVSEIPVTAAAVADLLLIPCVPSVFNMEAMAPTVKLVRRAAKPAFFVVNRGRSKGINDECALALASAYGLPATNAHITHRMPIADAEQDGMALPEVVSRDASVTKGKAEFAALWAWLSAQAQPDDHMGAAAL